MKKILKMNYKLGLGIITGIIVIIYAVSKPGSHISYYDKNSEVTAMNLNNIVKENYISVANKKNNRFVSAYTYNQTNDASNYCVTGDEATCKETTCYEKKNSESCHAGDIIKYKVNDTETVTFHVMYDNGSTLTMQSQKNIVNNVNWLSKSDYIKAGGTLDNMSNGNGMGPITAISALEQATKNWTNVNTQKYTMGTTPFRQNQYTGCSSICNKNIYTWDEKVAKARMITVQEAVGWLSYSSGYGPRWLADTPNEAYWTMNAGYNSATDKANDLTFVIYQVHNGDMYGSQYDNDRITSERNVKAVVEVDKLSESEVQDSNQDSIVNTPAKENQGSNQVVEVKNTLKTAYIGYCIGVILLILGIMVIYQTYKKDRLEPK